MMCEKALGFLNASDLRDLDDDLKAMLESLDYDGLVNAHAQREAVACARHFASVRDGLFNTWPWVFARKNALLTQTAPPLAGWRYAYVLPGDCLKLHELVLKLGTTPKYEQTGNIVACNYTNVSARYSARVSDMTAWPMLFENALCALLAQEIAPAVKAPEMAAQAFQMFRFAISEGYRTGIIDPGVKLDNNLANATLNTTRLFNPSPEAGPGDWNSQGGRRN
jgi:hypothetical protein